MSSRNDLLSQAGRKEASNICRALEKARQLVRRGVRNAATIKKEMLFTLKTAPHARLDYVEIVDAGTLEAMVELKPGARILIAAAVYFGKTRLIDNVLARVK